MACQLHAAAFPSHYYSWMSNLHLNVLTNFDPIMSKVIGAVWAEMTAPPAEIARLRIPLGDDLMPESARPVRRGGQIMTHYARDGPTRTRHGARAGAAGGAGAPRPAAKAAPRGALARPPPGPPSRSLPESRSSRPGSPPPPPAPSLGVTAGAHGGNRGGEVRALPGALRAAAPPTPKGKVMACRSPRT